MHSFPSEKVKLVKHVKIYHAFISAFKAKANHRFSCIQTCIHSKIINLKMVSWSSDIRSSKKFSPDPKVLICWPPAEARSHLFWHLILCRSKVLAIHLFSDSLQKQSHNFHLFSRLPAEAKSPSFESVDMLILCKCKITFVFLTPCRSKVITFIYFLDSLCKQSHYYLNLLICWPTAEARAHLFLALDPLQKQGLGHSLFFNSLQKQSNNHSSRSSAEARSPHFFSTRHKARTKSVSLSWLNFYFDNTNFSQTSILSCKT